jgi:hypothetical protein
MYTRPEDSQREPEHVANYLSDVIAAAWTAFDLGRATAEEFFNDDRPYDPHLYAHLARYQALVSLARTKQPRQWHLRPLRHSGIEFFKHPFRVRVCKAIDGGPQSPGRSHAARDFFQQLRLGIPLHSSKTTNLILYWRVRRGDLDLGLCKPKGLWRFKGQPKLEWRRPVQYDPLAGLSFPGGNGDIDELRFDDDEFGGEAQGE